jgi:putative glycerol-1-phosphate prenyltransferase
MASLLERIIEKKKLGQKSLAVLIDPDHTDKSLLEKQISVSIKNEVDFFFVGGSLITDDTLEETLKFIQSKTSIPTIIFPGSIFQINPNADGILLLSLISGRNPELLIGQHVLAAPALKKSGLELLSTGYILVDAGAPTTASYISGSLPIPHNKPNIAAATAMAGEMLGMGCIFLDAGSGAQNAVSDQMIKTVSKSIERPLIVGGGIKSAEEAKGKFNAGADLIVVGNGAEENPHLISEIAAIR